MEKIVKVGYKLKKNMKMRLPYIQLTLSIPVMLLLCPFGPAALDKRSSSSSVKPFSASGAGSIPLRINLNQIGCLNIGDRMIIAKAR